MDRGEFLKLSSIFILIIMMKHNRAQCSIFILTIVTKYNRTKRSIFIYKQEIKLSQMAFGYKDIINYSIIRRLKERMSDACIIFNNLVKRNNIDNRESEYYEVYMKQYSQDLNNLGELRDRCLKIADECNKIMMNMNVYHIKQYYIDPAELSEYEDQQNYINQIPSEEPTTESPKAKQIDDDEEDIW